MNQDKNNDASPKKGEDDYNLAYKYNMIWDVIIHNVNAMSNRVGLEIFGDETSWIHQEQVKYKSVLSFKIINKNGVLKGGKIVLVANADHVQTITYVHWHMVNNHSLNFKAQLPNEVILTNEKL